MKKILAGGAIVGLLMMSTPAFAAIQYGSTTQQSSLAPGATQQVGNLINNVVSGNAIGGGTANASGTPDVAGALGGLGRFFAGVNTWLKDKAGIDFFGILKGIGHFFLIVIQFVVDLVRKAL